MNEEFLDEKILSITSLTPILSISKIPWFADFAYFLVGDYLPKDLTYQQEKKFFLKLKHYIWEDSCTSFVLTK